MAHNMLLTKVLATVGPATETVDMLCRLIDEGARVFRINFSHGAFDEFSARIANVREASRVSGVPIGILGDLSGPKIRIERVEEPFDVGVGDFVEFTATKRQSQRYPDTGVTVLSSTYPAIVEDAAVGDRVFINDGAVRMLVIDKVWAEDDDASRLHCRVTHGGKISNKKGINLPDSQVSAPSLTDWDRQCAEFAAKEEVEYLALSFVRKAADIDDLRNLLKELARDKKTPPSSARIPIVAKIEKPEAIEELEGIVDAADGIMVARGDLGVEMEAAEVPVLQKKIIRCAHNYGKPVIVATQMLESMIENSQPTRAEVSDVANAIYEGADAVMLSGETAVGKHPEQAVHMMAKTARTMEALVSDESRKNTRPPAKLREGKYRTAALAHAVSVVVNDLNPKFAVCWSELGGTARYLSQNRLSVPILAFSSNEAGLRRMALLFGVEPFHVPRPKDSAEFLVNLDDLLLSRGWCVPGDPIVIVKGEPIGTPGVTNQLQIHYVGDVCRIAWHVKD